MSVDIRDLIAHAKRVGATEVTLTIKLGSEKRELTPAPWGVDAQDPDPEDDSEETAEQRIERERKSRLVPDGYDADVLFPK